MRTLESTNRAACLISAGQYEQAIAALGVAATQTSHDDAVRNYLESLGFACPAGGLEREIAALRKKIAQDAENPQAHFALGALLVYGGRLEEAELRFTQVLSICRDHVEALVCLGLCHQLRGDLEQGVTRLRQAQSLRPGDPMIALFLANACNMSRSQGKRIDLCAAVTNDS